MTAQCSIAGCQRPVTARGLCQKHWQRWKKHGDPLHSLIDRGHAEQCSIEGCALPYYARGLCKRHYEHAKYHGTVRSRRHGTCSVAGCGGMVYAKGLCQRCYQRARWRAQRASRTLKSHPKSDEPGFAAEPTRTCWADGCERLGRNDSGLCDEHHAIAEGWNEISSLGICCYKDCGREPTVQTADWEFPLCEYHEQTAFWAMALERDFGLSDAPTYTDNDWLSARFLAEVFRDEHGNRRRSAYRKVSGPPVFKSLFATMLTLVPWMQKNIG